MSMRMAPWFLAALVAGCAASTPEPETVPAPVIQVGAPARAADTAVDGENDDAARDEAEKQAENVGILGLLEQGDAAELFGTDDSGIGGLIGDDQGSYGAGGLGTIGARGGGLGDGGGLGSIGTLGRGSGGGSGYGSGAGGRSHSQPVRTGAASVKGQLDKDVIRRIVRRHINQVRYCYERQLLKEPDLEGRITVEFVIARDGSVTSASVVDGMQKDVDACVQKAVKSMSFPKPSGDGVVTVRYPFVFTAAQQAKPKAPDSKPPAAAPTPSK